MKDKTFTWKDVEKHRIALPAMINGMNATLSGVMRLMVVGLLEAFQKTADMALQAGDDVQRIAKIAEQLFDALVKRTPEGECPWCGADLPEHLEGCESAAFLAALAELKERERTDVEVQP